MEEVAPGASKNLKPFIKFPMVSVLSLAGLQSGLMTSCMKWFSELIAQGSFGPTEFAIMGVCIVVTPAAAVLQLRFLNKAISRYQQIEV